jgi:P2 family phage major capsid protein
MKATNLSNAARLQVTAMYAAIAATYGADNVENFTATASLTQELNDKIVEDGNPFLSLISTNPVTEVAGEKIGLSLSGRVSSRTDTSGVGERSAKRLLALDNEGYELKQVDSDVALTYAQIDNWSKFKDFRDRYGKAVRLAIGNDRLQAGWTGTSAAATTVIGDNPLLQDLNPGWLYKIRNWNTASQYLIGTEGEPIELGGVQFPNLDSLVHEAKQLIPVWNRKRPDLVALISDDLMANQEAVYYAENGGTPTEKILLNNGIISRAYGGLPSVVPPFFPDGTILITPLKNLALYFQDSSWRRQMMDNPKKNQFEDYNSRNEGYVVEDYEMTALLENITIPG